MSTTAPAPTRPEVEEAIRGHLATLRRLPAHWTDQRAELHAKIDVLLYLWQECE